MPDKLPDGGWHRRAMPRGTWWAVPVVVLVVAVAVSAELWPVLAVLIYPAFLLVRSVVDVRVDATGLTVRSPLGRPRLHVPAAEVLRAEVRAHVEPVKDFGGHGWRTSQGGTRGVVVRAGEALVVDRADDSPVVVTVDDAAGAAAALTAASRATRLR